MQGENHNPHGDDVRDGNAYGADNVPIDHSPVTRCSKWGASLKRQHGLHEQAQENHKLGG